ncbi:MAG: YraN family protein [Planctomycetaceae bacterium]|nr:YraN family protein [Planctomycetaceae bacterium]
MKHALPAIGFPVAERQGYVMWTWFRALWQRWTPGASSFGTRGELAAERYLERLGYRVLRRQHRNVGGELDLIVLDGDTVVFVEVKTRRGVTHGQPVDAVDRNKQRRMTRAALVFLKQQRWMDRRSRFDIVTVVWAAVPSPPQITHYRHAFEATGDG